MSHENLIGRTVETWNKSGTVVEMTKDGDAVVRWHDGKTSTIAPNYDGIKPATSVPTIHARTPAQTGRTGPTASQLYARAAVHQLDCAAKGQRVPSIEEALALVSPGFDEALRATMRGMCEQAIADHQRPMPTATSLPAPAKQRAPVAGPKHDVASSSFQDGVNGFFRKMVGRK